MYTTGQNIANTQPIYRVWMMVVFIETVVDHLELWIYDRINAKRQASRETDIQTINEKYKQQAMQQ